PASALTPRIHPRTEKFAVGYPIFLPGLKRLFRLANHLKLIVAEKLLGRSLDPGHLRGIGCGWDTFSAITRPLHTFSAPRRPGTALTISAINASRSGRARAMRDYLAA